MLHFIAGVLVGSLAATYAIALISNTRMPSGSRKSESCAPRIGRSRRNTPAPSAWRCTGGHAA